MPTFEHNDICHVTWEIPPNDKASFQYMMEVDTEQTMLGRKAEWFAPEYTECERLMELCKYMKKLEADKVNKTRISQILHCVAHLPQTGS